ncbi:hypothetical protein [Hyphomicrobium sp. CS1GBMeth3]|uniref:hypothetical protein n=1 Tax=Hyphomicrobium sp. CS1GBMeth3 TaxID=1892845 RepID=UPI0009309A2D|nr:hypothetical protein [Hyphomicrobium sp. CS1GBMeth3]
MPRLSPFILVAVAIFAAGCTREAVREMGSLKDDQIAPAKRSAETASSRKTEAAEVEAQGDGDALETGSIDKIDCQGEHLAYQATKEYLKNFGPKPQDLPGERGPCRPGAQ